MKTLVLLIVVGLIATGCISEKRCARRFPPVTITVINDSIVQHDTTIYRDTTIAVLLPRDTVRITEIVNVSSGVASMNRVVKSDGIITASAEIVDGQLMVVSWLNDSSIFVTLKNAIKERNSYLEAYHFWSKTEQKSTIVYELHWWQKWLNWIGIIALLFAIYKVYTFLKTKFH